MSRLRRGLPENGERQALSVNSLFMPMYPTPSLLVTALALAVTLTAYGEVAQLPVMAGIDANRLTLLRDTDGDGVAEARTVFIEGLKSPFGMALIGKDFYVANSDAVVSTANPDAKHSTRR